MAKLAEQKGERTFSPIADKLIEAVSAPEVRPHEPIDEKAPEKSCLDAPSGRRKCSPRVISSGDSHA